MQEDVSHLACRIGLGKRGHRGLHLFAPGGVAEDAIDRSAQRWCRQRRVGDHDSSASGGERRRIERLVIVCRPGPRHEDRGTTSRCDFVHGAAGACHDKIGCGEQVRHVARELEFLEALWSGTGANLAAPRHEDHALPSGRVLCYPLARMEDDGEVSYAKAAWKMAANADEWPRAKLWPGLACENVVQATAACLLRDALRRIDAIPDMVVVAHVHDEIVVEAVDKEAALERLLDVMSSPPAWAKGLPLAAEGRTAERFGK